METITKKTIIKLRREAANAFIHIGEDMRRDGKPDREIIGAFQKYQDVKMDQFYKRLRRDSRRLDMDATLARMQAEESKGSKIEMVMYDMLSSAGIPFEFQYKIGPYRVDYLLDGVVVFECDGKQHADQRGYDKRRDRYLEGLGYHVVRMSWDLIAQVPDVVISELKSLSKEIRNNQRV